MKSVRSGWAKALIATIVLTVVGAANETCAAPPPPTVFPYGLSWYPEQEDEAGWGADLSQMRTANITFVRMGEFAWSRMEPREGVYDFGWLDRAIALAKARRIKVLLGTPTAAPPAWLTTKYPETLLIDAAGQRAKHGGRRHFSVGSAVYRQKAAGIAAELARRYGHDPSVIGFQIDNEYGRDTRDSETRAAFQKWLSVKYGDVARMNAAWFATNWSQTYDDWTQVNIPGPGDNPGLVLDWQRFWSEFWREYQQNQIDAMRPHLAADKILTTNFVAHYDNFDYSVPAQKLDVVGWDWYFEGQDFDPAEGGMLHDLYRGFLGRNPWVIEAAAGNIVYVDRNFTQAPNINRAMVWQAVGHGADAYAFWVWQPPLNGNEPFHGSLVDTAGRPRPVFAEIAKTGAEIAKVWPRLHGTTPVAEVAMLHDYPSRWALKRLPMTKDYNPWSVFVAWHRAFGPAVSGIDVLRGAKSLDKYRMVIAPALHIIGKDEAEQLATYVRGGGHLVIGPRSGVKDETSSLWMMGQPGPLSALLGSHVDQTEVLAKPIALEGGLGAMTANVWAERLVADAADLETIVRYGPSDGWLDRAPAVVSRRVGKGRVTYVGALLDDDALARVAIWAATGVGAKPLWPGIPRGVEVMARASSKQRTYLVINWTGSPQAIRLPTPMRDLLSGSTVSAVTLNRYGVAVVAP
jgi:beta-galactosidase